MTKKNKQYNWTNQFVYILLLLVACYIAYHFVPCTDIYSQNYDETGMDLTRYYMEISDIGTKTFQQTLVASMKNREPLRFVIWFILAKLPSLRFVQVASISCMFFALMLSSFVSIKETNEFVAGRFMPNTKTGTVFLSVFILFCLLNFIEALNSIRCVLAYFLLVIGIMDYFIHQKKVRGITIMAVASLLHFSGWGIIIIVLVNKFFEKHNQRKWIFLISFPVISMLGMIIKNIPINKVSDIGATISSFGYNYFTFNVALHCILKITFLSTLYFLIKGRKKDYCTDRMSKLLTFIQILILISISGINTTLGDRLVYIVAMLSPVIVVINCKISFNINRISLKQIVLYASGIGLLTYETLKALLLMNKSGAYFDIL